MGLAGVGGGSYAVEKGTSCWRRGRTQATPAAGALGVLSTRNAEVGVGPQCSWEERPGVGWQG